jgi:hypothetical protein
MGRTNSSLSPGGTLAASTVLDIHTCVLESSSSGEIALRGDGVRFKLAKNKG